MTGDVVFIHVKRGLLKSMTFWHPLLLTTLCKTGLLPRVSLPHQAEASRIISLVVEAEP
jgi:hypothetical protein